MLIWPNTPSSIATGDLNDDGKLDLVVAASTYASYCPGCYYSSYQGYLNVLIGNGAAGFAEAAAYPLADRLPNGVVIGDVNHDHKDDIVASNNYGALSVLLGNGNGTLIGPLNTGSGSNLRSLPLGDVDGDGNVDTVLRDYGGGLSVQKGGGAGHFTAQPGVTPGISVNAAP